MTGVSLRFAALMAGLGAAIAVPAIAMADPMSPVEARRFVVGRYFTYTCFEGTRGAGKVNDDGSLAGHIRVGGKGPQRFVRMPADTLRVRDGSVCASVRGLPFEPCFNLVKTSSGSFRGSVSGLGFAYCDFNRTSARAALARDPVDLQPPRQRSASAGN